MAPRLKLCGLCKAHIDPAEHDRSVMYVHRIDPHDPTVKRGRGAPRREQVMHLVMHSECAERILLPAIQALQRSSARGSLPRS